MNSCTKTEGWLRGKQNQMETLRKKMEHKIDLYNQNPIVCKQCNKSLTYKEAQRGKAFCDHSCAAVYNNAKRQITISNTQKPCPVCSNKIQYRYNQFCSKKCSSIDSHNKHMEKNVKKFLHGELTDKSRAQIKRVLIHLGVPYKCAVCNINEWMDKPLSLILDHIDGKANNNNLNNLRFLCHNCDSQSEFYKSKNKGNGRKSLGLI